MVLGGYCPLVAGWNGWISPITGGLISMHGVNLDAGCSGAPCASCGCQAPRTQTQAPYQSNENIAVMGLWSEVITLCTLDSLFLKPL